MKSYEYGEDEDKNEELIKPTEDIDNSVLNTHLEMAALLKMNRKRRIDDTTNLKFNVESRSIFGSESHEERLFSYYKYIKTEIRNRLTPQFIKAITILKIKGELWEYLQKSTARAILINTIKNSRVYKKMEEDKVEENRINCELLSSLSKVSFKSQSEVISQVDQN